MPEDDISSSYSKNFLIFTHHSLVLLRRPSSFQNCHWDPRLIGGRRVLHHCTILVHSWPLTSAKMLFTRPKSLIWSFFSLKLRYPALYSIYSSGAGFIAACNYNYTLFLFNCQLRISWCHSPYATAELFDEIKVSPPLFHWALIFQ